MSAEMVVEQGIQQKLYLVGDRILVRPAPEPEKLGTMYVPETTASEHRPLEGDAVMTGDTVKYVKAGDRVIYGPFNGQKITINGDEFLVLREAEVMAGWRPDPAQEALS